MKWIELVRGLFCESYEKKDELNYEKEKYNWVPITEKKPLVGEKITVSANETVFPIARFDGKKWEYLEELSWDYWVEIFEPDAWRSIPEPYVKEDV